MLAISLKLILGTLGVFVSLPFSGADARTFERIAWSWSQLSIPDILMRVDVSRSYVISSVTAIFYSLLERNIAIPIFINVSLAILVFFFSLRLANRVWNDQRLNVFFALVVALHPVMNVNSAVILRETYIYFFVVLASISLASFAWTGRLRHALTFLVFVVFASFFHGAMILLALGFPLFAVVGSDTLKPWKKLSFGAIFSIVFIFVLFNMDLGKLQDLQEGEVFDVEYFANLESRRQEANTAYLTGLTPSNPLDLVWQAPVRVIFLLTKPFPWDVRSFGHAIVFFDAVIWWLIIYLLIKNWSEIRRNPACLALICMAAVALVAFSYGTSNFGTGVRHRTKFFVIAWVLVYPFLPRFRFGGAGQRSLISRRSGLIVNEDG
ncbi:MAG: hypothetical protein ACN2B6_12245 [Rickettsiales bacterium]